MQQALQGEKASPKGFHDASDCSSSRGWACDADDYSKALEIRAYSGGPAGKGVLVGTAAAALQREAAVGAECGGFSAHGFNFPTPASLKDGKAHPLYIYAVNIGGTKPDTLLAGSPRGIDCAQGDKSISAAVDGSPLVVRTASRLAGAIGSLTWKGKEFINSWDHGRELQSASSFDGYGECYNPTEAGSASDGTGPSSTSELLSLSASGNRLESRTQMAFWLPPGETRAPRPGYCPNGRAENTTALSGHVLSKEVTIGYKGIDRAIDYRVRFTVPEVHSTAAFEALTGYMPGEFSKFWTYDPVAGSLEALSDGPGEQPLPVILATPDSRFAMGVYSPGKAGYGRFRFDHLRPEANATNKWNCVYRVQGGVPKGDHAYRCFVTVGTLAEAAQAIGRLHALFAPSIRITAPARGAVLRGTATVSASVASSTPVARVAFSIDGALRSNDYALPFEYAFDSRSLAVGTHALTATAYDALGLAASTSVVVRVDNPMPFTRYAAPGARGGGTSAKPEHAADYLDPSFWSSVQSQLSGGNVTVVFLNGDYRRGGLTLSKMGDPIHVLTLQGESKAGTVFRVEDPTPAGIFLKTCRNVVLRRFTFTGKAAAGYATSFGHASEHVTMEDSDFIDLPNIVYGAAGAHHRGTKFVTFKNLRFERVGSDGAHMIYNAYEPDHVYVLDSTFTDCAGHFVRFRAGTEHGVVRGCTFKDTGTYPYAHRA
jgi:hypothetical protein